MNLLKGRRGWMIGRSSATRCWRWASARRTMSARRSPRSAGLGRRTLPMPTYSSPIAMSADNSRIWVVNPDDDSVSVIDPSTDQP